MQYRGIIFAYISSIESVIGTFTLGTAPRLGLKSFLYGGGGGVWKPWTAKVLLSKGRKKEDYLDHL